LEAARQRLDKFLFFARAVKSRTLAQKLIEAGAVRVNGDKTVRTDLKVGPGDVLTLAFNERLLVWKILDAGSRRGPASEAATLYEDLSPPPLPRQHKTPFELAVAPRLEGTGRPTKKERRQTDALRPDHED